MIGVKSIVEVVSEGGVQGEHGVTILMIEKQVHTLLQQLVGGGVAGLPDVVLVVVEDVMVKSGDPGGPRQGQHRQDGQDVLGCRDALQHMVDTWQDDKAP